MEKPDTPRSQRHKLDKDKAALGEQPRPQSNEERALEESDSEPVFVYTDRELQALNARVEDAVDETHGSPDIIPFTPDDSPALSDIYTDFSPRSSLLDSPLVTSPRSNQNGTQVSLQVPELSPRFSPRAADSATHEVEGTNDQSNAARIDQSMTQYRRDCRVLMEAIEDMEDARHANLMAELAGLQDHVHRLEQQVRGKGQ